MKRTILDLDGSLPVQQNLVRRHQPRLLSLADWGPRLRLGCGFGQLRRFEQALAARMDGTPDGGAFLTLYGSGDFHHVSLALVRRLHQPFNLLVLDNHPDWMRGLPFLHCGTWLYHAARLPQVRRVFHVGGDVDFDNYYRWLLPGKLLRERKIVVFPSVRHFQHRPWSEVDHEPLRPARDTPLSPERLEELLRPWREELAALPLYISLDKDVMRAADAVVNWDSGHLTLGEVRLLVEAFGRAAVGRLAGMDIVGDWSPVAVQGVLRRFLHITEHPNLAVDPEEAAARNEQTNLALLESVGKVASSCRTELPDRDRAQTRSASEGSPNFLANASG